ncbi:hypothetical protein BAE44_0005726, partial [Dichanthelium oligosanthes]
LEAVGTHRRRRRRWRLRAEHQHLALLPELLGRRQRVRLVEATAARAHGQQRALLAQQLPRQGRGHGRPSPAVGSEPRPRGRRRAGRPIQPRLADPAPRSQARARALGANVHRQAGADADAAAQGEIRRHRRCRPEAYPWDLFVLCRSADWLAGCCTQMREVGR